ncbi:BREX-1 system phosphatase PglZ type A [Candidatus Laterigemmans baculatus]|uniref:BREX-1 system phosphatase PglZ type A n=1 Tax=Candidatus Laterigemmans baculatus TaxID=2770505 RepID=UPI0013D9BE57|nr:BREX-1 system phosphatase PglZ type A [Candidatus Laterigemmans baculatus]
MDTKQLTDALERLFDEEGERIVFWNDPEKEFLNFFEGQLFSPLANVEVVRLDQIGGLEAKLRIEQEQPNTRFLLYSPAEEPEFEKDWLLDVRLYSRSFRADRASIILDELKLNNQHLRGHVADRRKFFDNKDRLAKLKGLTTPDDNEGDLDRKMLAVVTKADQPELFNIIRTLFHAFTDESELDIRQPPAVWEQIAKFELDKSFWQMVKVAFGYEEETPSLGNFLTRLLVTDYAQHLKSELPGSLLHLQLPATGRANTVVCLAQWRDSSSRAASYDLLSEQVAASIHLSEHLHDLEIDALIDAMTFLDVEKAICRGLRDRVESTPDTINVDDVQEIAGRRSNGHWVSPSVQGAPHIFRKALRAVYEALVAAADFFNLRNQHQDGFEFDTASAMYRAYEQDLFRFDQLYRHFCEAADTAEAHSFDVLKNLREQVEAAYVNWYITQMSLAWGKFVDRDLLSSWKIAEVPNQQQFFARHVQPRLKESDKRKAFVIISDAFRYEAAEELARQLNGQYRFEAELSSQLGVLPSYTRLGMASLLPHKSLSYNAKGDVLCDGRPTMSSDQRSEILAPLEGIVVKADTLLGMKKREGRELVGGHRVVYAYHDRIDSTGDDRKSEGETFEAVRRTIGELCDLVRHAINSLNFNYVVVTADHGFLFTETPPGETDKSKLSDTPPGTVVAKKRYLIGHNLGNSEEAWHGDTKTTAGADGGMEFWVPKGANRFHFMGGARFIHGGAMPQEICVPVLTVRHRKDEKTRERTKEKTVTVHLLGTKHRITTPRHRFEFIQMEPVSERVKSATYKVAVYEANEPVTNIEKISFDSTSDNMEDRKRSVTLVLQDRKYDKKTKYRLVLRDADTDIERQSVDIIIDRAFTDDF